MAKTSYRSDIGKLIKKTRLSQNLTQADLAKKLGTSQSAINRIERGKQNLSLDLVSEIDEALSVKSLSVNNSGATNLRIHGGKKLHGSVTVNTSKNAAMGLLFASLINNGKTTLRNIARIEEVNRITEVFNSVGIRTNWINDKKDLEIIPPKELNLEDLDQTAARRTRSIIMLLGSLLHKFPKFRIPFAGGCSLGERTIEPHLRALSAFGLSENSRICNGFYDMSVNPIEPTDKKIVLIERGDTVTENALIAAALFPHTTTIINASSNYMVQDVCFYLQQLGVKIDGIGTTILRVHGLSKINQDVTYFPSEDPIEAMSFLAAGIVTHSEITIKRAPIEFLEVELETLNSMHLNYSVSREYSSNNGRTRLADITIFPSKLIAPKDKIHPMPFPGLNIDNLPFFAVIAATAHGRTLIHDWVFENRAIYLADLAKLNANVSLIDAHRIYIEGPTRWRPADLTTPPALRPAVVILIAMLAAPGTSVLRNTYMISRGYADFSNRLNSLGAGIETEANI